jgi:hypothetical protein
LTGYACQAEIASMNYILFLLFTASTIIAGDATQPVSKANPIRVQVIVEGISNPMDSKLRIELRKFPDVLLVEKEPDYIISLVAYQLQPRGGNIVGFAISCIVLSPAGGAWGKCDGAVRMEHQYAAFSTANDDFQDFAAGFDKDIFEPYRQARQSAVDILKKLKTATPPK